MNRRRRAIIALTFVVSGAVGYESWQAAAAAAETGGRPNPLLWPVTLEAFIAVLVLVYWEARSAGRSAWQARVMLVATTALASIVQILDVDPGKDHTLGVVTAGWTPIALLLTVEFATWLLYGKAPTSERDRKRTPEVERQAPERVATTAPPVPAAKGSPRERLPEREGRPGGSTPAAAPARSGVAPPTPERVTKSADPWPERARLIREHLAADPTRSTRQIEAALRSTEVGPGERGRFGELVKQLRSEMKQESNGAPERESVLS